METCRQEDELKGQAYFIVVDGGSGFSTVAVRHSKHIQSKD